VGEREDDGRLRADLVASEELYRTLFDESPDACLVLGPDGTILDANAASGRVFGADPAVLAGRSARDLGVADRFDEEGIAETLERDGRLTMRVDCRRLDEGTFPAEASVTSLTVGSGRRLFVRVRDLTDQERHQRELVQAQKMEAIGILVSGVAHELNNPLAAIIGYSTLLRRDERLPDDMRHDADVLLQEADRTRRIVQNLLDFARQRPPERHPTALRALVESILELQSYLITANRTAVTVDIPDDLPTVDVDRGQLQQVLLNLTVNAIQAIRSGSESGRLELVARRRMLADGRAGIRLTITDDGPGVPEAARSRLFMPFFTTKPPGQGTGLGLSVSFGIVAAHGGSLAFEPGPGGRGAQFIVELPLDGMPAGSRAAPPATSAAAATAPAAPTAPASGLSTATAATNASFVAERVRVLVLDDEPSILAFLRKALTLAGCDPVLVETGEDALARLRSETIDCVLCDYRMSGMSGTEVYESAIEIRPDLTRRFIFMSGDVLNPDLRSFAETHRVALLAKPFDIDAVGRAVRLVMGVAEP
jgi:PAS domain S-box-containing protein